ncbi:DUF4157 domain-containing protein [Streptomyces sp. NPDC001985]|uniref:eCIS core domain-containing protein n=1 Tax=Streptomyces sp. NPDC001985 TaxID=3154406 RepID=UPI00331B2015
MSAPPAAARDDRSARAERRRRLRERAASRAPEPKNIVSGAGQPLDTGVRRELEERLGHDLSRVRLHTDRDAGALTELLGADAVAVGAEIFFREGAYRPGTADGLRLLAHELLHTVQNPDGLGALRAGRDLGAVSLPQQEVEREAESAALGLVRSGEPEAAPEAVAPGRATPGWLRYATVDADRTRAERLDPATLVDRLANGVLRSLRGDPADLSGRVRLRLAQFSPRLQDSVLGALEHRLLTPEYDRLLDLADRAADTGPLGLQPAGVPEPETDLLEELGVERVRRRRERTAGRAFADRRDEDAREERGDAGARDERQASERSRARSDAEYEGAEAARRTEQEDERARSRERSDEEQRQEEEKQAGSRARGDEVSDERARGQRETAGRAEEDGDRPGTPGADERERRDSATRPAAGSRPEPLAPKAEPRPGPVRPERVDERAEQPDSALSEHGLHEKDEAAGEPLEAERPLGLEPGAGDEIGGGEGGGAGAGGVRTAPGAAAEVELKPEDYLPETDLDLSSVPTAEGMAPGDTPPPLPVFPAPPPTRAERIERQRESEAREEDEDGPGPEARAPGEDVGPVEGEAPRPEGGPVAEARDRGVRELRAERPVDQEIGPNPGTVDRERQEPEPERREPGAADTERKPDEEPDEQREEPGARPSRDAAGERPESASASPARPAGAQPRPEPVEDRGPSPAAGRDAEPPKPEREAPAPRSGIPGETGSGASARSPVGGREPVGPTAAAGPGAAPSAARSGVSPAGEPSAGHGSPAPEASLEKDGGGCAPPEPSAEKNEGKDEGKDEGKGGCGGGGGGGETAEEKPAEPPDVSAREPGAAVATVGALAPDVAAAAMPGVERAADRKVGEEQRRLEADPPTRERPSGAPRTRSGPPGAAAPAAPVSGKVERIGPEDQGGKQRAKGGEKARGQRPTDSTSAPSVPASGTELSAEDARSIDAAADAVPTVDPELRDKTVGPAPKIRLEGASDPTRTDEQAKALREKQSELRRTGREDAAKPMGEDQIFPDAPPERLTGRAAGRAGGAGGPSAPGSAAEPGVGTVAQQERGPELRSAAGQAQGDLGTKEREHRQGEQRAEREKRTGIDGEIARNAERQASERGRAAEEARRERASWRTEQDRRAEDADRDAEKEHTDRNKEIVKARDDKDKEVGDRKNADNARIDAEREKAEREAERKKEEKKPSGGFFGWVADKVKSAFNAILEAVTAVFDAARRAVNGIIDTFKEWANKAIDFVRDLAIKAIDLLADVLIAIGDVLLAAFPELRDRFREAIEGLRDRAIAAVDQLADGLKKAVNTLLDALAAGLNTLLDVLEAGLKAVIKAYQAVILGAIRFARAAIAALGKFAALIADIAPDPGGWLRKAGGSAKAGITDHLWGAVKTGVKRWFDTKVEGILGLGRAVIDVLVKGCVSVKQIGRMAWDAIIASLPMMIASLVIEKVVSMLVPAAGAILTIVQGLMAAWQSLSSILTAFGKFWAYLRAVRAGPAACLFAEAVAAGIVALLDFLTNFLMIRLESATKGVGKRLRAMSEKIMNGLRRTGRGARKAAGAAVNRAREAVRRAHRALNRPPATPRPRAKPSPPPKSPPRPKKPATPKEPVKSAGHIGNSSRDMAAGQKSSAPGAAVKRKEIDGPKPVRPRKSRSPLSAALKRVKSRLASALKGSRNAARGLGRKLNKSTSGKALKNSASRLHRTFEKKRSSWLDDKKKQQDQEQRRQNDRSRKERARESKEERLRRTVARIKPRLTSLLGSGVRDRVFHGVLTATRIWYGLSDLLRTKGSSFDVVAALNPRLPAIEQGRELREEDFERRVMEYIRSALREAEGGKGILSTYLQMKNDKGFKKAPKEKEHQYNTGSSGSISITRIKGPASDLSGKIVVHPHESESGPGDLGPYSAMADASSAAGLGSSLGTHGLQILANVDDMAAFPHGRQLPAQFALTRAMAEGLRTGDYMLAVAAAELRLVELGERSPDDVLRSGPLVQTGANRLTSPIRGFLNRTAQKLKKLSQLQGGKIIKQKKKPLTPEQVAKELDLELKKLGEANRSEITNRAWLARKDRKVIGRSLQGKDIWNIKHSDITAAEYAIEEAKLGTSAGELGKMRQTIIDLLLAENVITTDQHRSKRIEDLVEGVDKLFGDRDWLINTYGVTK